MKKNILYTLVINYLLLFMCTLNSIVKKMSFFEFITRSMFLLIALNVVLFIFFNIILKNINKTKNNIDIVIPPIDSDIKDILNENDGQEDDNNEFKEINFKDLNN
ncbi:hypothetical protein [Tepidibacter thalassicus]|uniref:Uncharacterized protein n=1 Tax=Tepidibacter thalassicus DSM 15285 TaxID=1123350 RepID=A0A1M5NUT2_9FIRM|nr:hypothetical protein [Tepidibacter thalassicus]SHG93228.1 hypothetical protein SAMN02744040_00229 [Tepidibacter thalassicus DSM 15285]